MKRLVSISLAVVLLLVSSCAMADGFWTCPNCSYMFNMGAFCQECGTAKPAAQATAAPASPSQSSGNPYRVGQTVYFGRYYNTGYTADPIGWRVLAIDGDYLFLISNYGLEKKPFNDKSNGCTWKDSSIRRWLNNDFYYAAFFDWERDSIRVTQVDDGLSHCKPEWFNAGRIGGITEDKIFLLSYLEATVYLPTMDARMCPPTAHAISQGCNTSPEKYLNGQTNCWYWLRTPAFKNNAGAVDWDGSIATCYLHHPYGVVRPALWVYYVAVTQ